jgi:hypothetical protein
MNQKIFSLLFFAFLSIPLLADALDEKAVDILKDHCFDCHEEGAEKGGLNLEDLLKMEAFDGSLIFENLVTGKMPPGNKKQPSSEEKRVVLDWLAKRQKERSPESFRRMSRHEFVHAINDLLEVNLDLVGKIPEDRGTRDFDSDRRIKLSQEMLGAYFTVADEMLDFAFPEQGFPAERVWKTNKVKDSHETYRIYLRPYEEGLLFSWTRANNGNNYSFFYDNFDPPVAGWYDLTFDAMKVGAFEEDVTLQVYGGKYYYADDRPQPQRLLDVISLGNRDLKSHTIRVFLNPGENVSVHCYSQHTFRQKDPRQGAYIKQLKVRGPVFEQWPPAAYGKVFGELLTKTPPRRAIDSSDSKSRITVSARTPEDLKKVIRGFAEKAFSSIPGDEELSPYFSISETNFAEHGDFVRATKVGLKAIICSPRFLMTPGEHANPSYARAAHLARVLWLSTPDEELLGLSRSDQLSGNTIRLQIDRMLRDEKSQRMIRSFCDQWLNLRSLNKVTPSLKLYPKYDDLLDHFLPIETRSYLSHLIRENMSVGNLIDSDFSFLNQRLARHYGIEGVIGQEMRKVSFPAEVPRGGLLTMGSILKVTTDGYDTSPILRGAWISRNIVGTPLSPPPENIKAIEPAHGEAITLREQIDQHKSSKSCYACHKSIDPYGFALESFDATGQWRKRYRIKEPHNATFLYRMQGYYHLGGEVDASGEIDKATFEGVLGLKRILLSDQRKIAYNVARKFFEYANGYQPNLKQRLDLWDLVARDCGMKDLIAGILVYSLNEEQK